MLKTACGNGFPLNIPSVIPESGGSGGTSDYSELSNKPQINSITLSGNKSLSDLGIQPADIYFDETVTLSTTETTTVTFTDESITTNSVVDPAISVWGIFPEDVTVANGSCTVVMPKVSTAQTITVGIFIKR